MLPVEVFMLCLLLLVMLLAGLTGMQWYFPEGRSFTFVFEHYIGPLIPLFLITGVLAVIGKEEEKKRQFKFELLYLARFFFVIAVSIVIHFNLKLWSHLINPHNFDAIYQRVDLQLPQTMALFDFLHGWMPGSLPGMSNPYHGLFVLMFVISLTVHGLKNRKSGEAMVTAAVLMMVIGAAAYSIAPALGPFVHEFHLPSGPTKGQMAMFTFYEDFVGSNGQSFDPTFFSAGLAAMPSLHVGNAVMFWLCAWREVRWLAYVYAPIVAFIFIEAVALRWHYLVDLAAGALVGWLCYRLAYWMVLNFKPQVGRQGMVVSGVAMEKV
jgi:membrane-associated phospholipid phosphatase